ncbi:MAG: hypothetical protein QXZ12_08235 [Thermoplasmata archaeon]
MYLKNKATVILVTLLVVISMAIIVIPQASATATGSVSYTPTVFSINTPTLTVVSGGSFGSGSTVYFYLSSTTSSSGIIGSYIGYYTLSGGLTSLSNNHIRLTIPSTVVPGNYYLLASDSASSVSSGAQFTSPASITITSLLPSFSVTGSQPTTTGTVTGTGWDPGASISIYLAGADGTPLNYIYVATFTASVSGTLSAQITVPSAAQGSYTVVAQENSGSNAGITADSTMSITPILIASPQDINGASGTSLTITGYGFSASAKIAVDSINAGGVTITNSATTTTSSGYFSVSGALSSAITTTGPKSVTVTYNTSSYTQSNAFYVSVPTPSQLEFAFTIVSTTSYYYPGSAFKATVYNYPASSSVSIMLGNVLLGTIMTDSNGFGTLNGILPAMIAGTYYVSAVSNGLYASLQVSISAYYKVLDSSANLMTTTYSEYMPSNSTYTVIAYGLNPLNEYTFTDSGAGPASQVMSVTVGTYSSIANRFTSALNGTLIFTYKSVYSGVSTGTSKSISLGSVIGYNGLSFGYNAVGTSSYSISILSILKPSSFQTLTISSIIPKGANVYSGLTYIYNVYLDNKELSFTTTSGSTNLVMSSSSSSSNTGSLTFTVPSLANGVYNLSLVYNGNSVTNAVYSEPVIVSVAGNTPSSGSLTIVSYEGTTYAVGVGYYSAPTLYYMTYTGLVGPYSLTLTNGAFYKPISIIAEPAGSYAVFTVFKYTSESYYEYAYYNVVSTISLNTESGGISSSLSFTLSGFSANSYYNIYFGTINVGTYLTDTTGSLSSSFTVPIVPAGTYAVTVTAINSNSVIAAASYTIVPSSTITLSTNNYAFPTELVQFSWAPSTSPYEPSTGSSISGTGYGPVYVTVYLNGTAYTTLQATYGKGTTVYLNGSFTAPNLVAGAYWALSFGWTQNIYTIGTHTANGSTYPNTYIGKSATYFGLISGNGALLTGITPSEIATLEISINSTITSAMQVPLSELNAAVVSIEGTSVQISTAFGQMETNISAIKASIQTIQNGEVFINTTIGKAMTKLNNINAAIIDVNGSIIRLNSTLGTLSTTLNNLVPTITKINATTIAIDTLAGNINYNLTSFSSLQIKSMNNDMISIEGYINGLNVTMQSSLSALNGTVKTTAANVSSLVGSAATIQTDLGSISGHITTVQSGVASIQTSLGTLNVTVSSIKTTGSSNTNSLNTTFYFEIGIIILVLVILAFVVLIYTGLRKKPKFKEPEAKEWKKE